jgi:hypothetical protein
MLPKKGKIYLCEWKDIISNSSWIDKENIEEEIERDTKKKFDYVGRYLYEKNGYYCFEPGMCSDGDMFGYDLFPKSVIIKIKELK